MAYRVFASPDGTVWHAWDVPGDDRAAVPGSPPRSDALRQGWICFECEAEKRRLSPIPARWADRSDQDLWLFCRVADRVQSDLPAPVQARAPNPAQPAPENG